MEVRSTRKPLHFLAIPSLRVAAVGLLLAACSASNGTSPGSGGASGSGGSRAGSGGSNATGGVSGQGGNAGQPGQGGNAGQSSGGNGGTTTGGAGGGSPDAATGTGGSNADAAPERDAGGDVAAPVAGAPGPNATVAAFAGTHVYFLGTNNNKRTIDANVTFPEMPLTYQRINLTLALRCPPMGGCDFWDRRGFLGLVRRDGEKETVTEISRFMTPYRLPGRWTMDVTALRPMLSGAVTLRVFIDTWVGPGHAQGAGWLVDATFEFQGGVPARLPIAVIPLWDETQVDYGDPAKPLAVFAPTRTVTLPAGASSYEIRSFITGHGQGNTENCAEFCPKNHGFKVGDMTFQRQVWRDDCATTAVPNQAGP
ncbi:MAG TPA: peptide-N-glycosidase F-related protein, partial [Polyangia bacterium]